MERTLKFDTINKTELCSIISKDVLYIIGNGFDLAHGVKSSYRDFEKTVGKNSKLRHILEQYINKSKDEIWGDFEDSLAHIDRGIVISSIDLFLDIYDVKEEDDDDFKWSDYGITIDSVLNPLDELLYALPRRFKYWIQTLNLPRMDKLLQDIICSDAKFINFNYTEFLEILYGVKKSNILYIHGDRRNKKETLVLGHGHDSQEMFDLWWNEHKNIEISSDDIVSLAYFYDGDEYEMWKSQVRYDVTQAAIDRIEDYYDNSAKKTKDVIRKHSNFFNGTEITSKIIVLGHSLSFVDYPYFEYLIEKNSNANNLEWYISYFSDDDIVRIEKFATEMNIDFKRIKIFKL